MNPRPAQVSQSKVTVSSSSDRPANGFSNSPPTRTRVVVTLSDELSADISSQKVQLIKSDKASLGGSFWNSNSEAIFGSEAKGLDPHGISKVD